MRIIYAGNCVYLLPINTIQHQCINILKIENISVIVKDYNTNYVFFFKFNSYMIANILNYIFLMKDDSNI